MAAITPRDSYEDRPIVRVAWIDSCHVDGYDYPDDAWSHVTMHTVGYLLRDDPHGVVLGMERCTHDKDRHRGVSSIPRVTILSVEFLTEVSDGTG